MKSLFKRLMSVTLVVAMLMTVVLPHLPTIIAYASSAGGGNSDWGNDSWGYVGDGWIIGLGRCDNDEYTNGASGDVNDLYKWVMNYRSKYYEHVQGSAYFLSNQECQTPIAAGQAKIISTDKTGILQSIKDNSLGEYLEETKNGYAIKKDKISEVMDLLAECNDDLYRQWYDDPYAEKSKHPVVIVIEAVCVMDNGDGYTVEDAASMYGTSVYGMDLSQVERLPAKSLRDKCVTGVVSSATAKVVYDSIPTNYDERETLRWKVAKGLFGIDRKYHTILTEGDIGAHGCADLASDGAVGDDSDTNGRYITGCYIVAAGGIPSGEVPDTKFLHGEYQWDFDSVDIPKNPRGHLEDGVAQYARGSTVSGDFRFGFVDLKNSSAPAWRSYGQVYGGSSVKVELKVYGLGTGSGVDEYSTDSSVLKNKGTPNASGMISGLLGTYQDTFGWDEFVGYLENGTPDGIELGSMSGAVDATINGTLTGDMVAVAYYTELFVTPTCGGPQSGQKIQFVNNQVHYAIYNFSDDERTYKLAQTNLLGWSQLKDNAIASAQFEATTGTPTTEDMFISMGGSEYLVNMQYAMRVDDYDRTYHVTTKEPYDNYMYYAAGEGLPTETKTAVKKRTNDKVANKCTINIDPRSRGAKTGEGSKAYELFKYTIDNLNYRTFEEEAKKFHDAVQKLLEEDINSNCKQDENGGIYSADEEYDVVVIKGMTVTSDWQIEGIDDCVLGKNTNGQVDDTKKKLKILSDSMHNMYLLQKDKSKFEGEPHAYSDFSVDNRLLANGIEITFFDLVDDWCDYDSSADGAVKIRFQFQPRDAYDFKTPIKWYNHYDDFYYESKPEDHNHGIDGTHNGKDTKQPAIDRCREGGHNTDRSRKGVCSKLDRHEDGTSDQCGATTYNGSLKGDHRHFGHKNTGGSYRDDYGNIEWDPDPTDHKSPDEKPIETYGSKIIRGIDINYEAEGYLIAHEKDDMERGKKLSYDATLHQIYKSVKYMDIVEAHVWRLGGGVVDGSTESNGLSNLMVEETDTRVISPIIEMACSNLGYTLYNTQPIENRGYWAESVVTPDGHNYQKVWTAVDKDFAELCTMDPEDKTVDKMTSNNELSAIGRLANSFNPSSTEPKSPKFEVGSYVGNNPHALTCESSGDTLEFTYDIEKQGGRSHWSFDGFLKQAIALTFYKDADPKNAYRNYIIVQSDFLSLGEPGQAVTMSGFQWVTKPMDKEDGTYGLTQAVLNSGTWEEASDIANYWSETPWEKEEDLNKKKVNEDKRHMAGSDVKEGNGGQSEVFGKSLPTDKTCALSKYAEGPDQGDWGNYKQYKKDGAEGNTFVILDQDPEYGQLTLDAITGPSGSLESSISVIANFATEGKGVAATDLNFQGECFPTVGYVDMKDSVGANRHKYTPEGGSSTTLQPDKALVTKGWNGFLFKNYGSADYTSHLYEESGSSAAGAKKVSAASSPKNTIISNGLMFPYVTGLNVIRWMQNGNYGGYETALYYDECLNFMEALPGVQSFREVTTDRLALKEGLGKYTDSVVKDLHQNGKFQMILDGKPTGIGGTDGLLTGVSYDGATCKGSGKTNAVTIFNPSTAVSGAILPISEKLPDGQNNLKNSDNVDDGYGERDQRVDEYPVSSNNKETYISYSDLNLEEVEIKSKSYEYTMLSESKIPTEPYTLKDNDYACLSRSSDTWTVTAGSEPMHISKSGNYRLTLFSGKDTDTSVELRLQGGDEVFYDGQALYLRRGEDQAPLITYDQLANSVAAYYQSVDNKINAEGARVQEEEVSEYIKANTSTVDSLHGVCNTLNFNWPGLTLVDNITPMSNTVDAYNEAVTDFNERVKELYEAIPDAKGNYGFINDIAYNDLLSIEEKMLEVRDSILERAGELSYSCELTDMLTPRLVTEPYLPPENLNLMEHSSGYYVVVDDERNPVITDDVMTFYLPGSYTTPVYAKLQEDGRLLKCDVRGNLMTPNRELKNTAIEFFDYETYFALRDAESELVNSIFESKSIDTILTEINEKLFKCYEYATGNDELIADFAALVNDYNVLTQQVVQQWNVKGDTLVLTYADGYNELNEFLFDINNLRSEIIDVANLNSQRVVLNTVPTIEIVAKEGKAATFKHNDCFDVEQGATMSIDFSGLRMSKGSTLVVRMPFDKNYTDPVHVELSTDGSMLDFMQVATNFDNTSGYNHTLYKYQEGNDWVYVIEALDDLKLGRMTFEFLNDASIMNVSSDASRDYVAFDKVWLCDVGGNGSKTPYLGTTIEHNHYKASSIYWNKSGRTRSLNKLLFDTLSKRATINVTDIKNNTLYISREYDSNMILTATAKDNPHKVYNANWRYYVVGWKTTDGVLITSPDNAALYENKTKLVWPGEASDIISVEELSTQACLVKYNNEIYLTTKDAGLKHKILETGATVDRYDDFTLGVEPKDDHLPVRDIDSSVDGHYPLKSGKGVQLDTNIKYEFFFEAQDTDTYLYDVQHSLRPEYRFSQNDNTLLENEPRWSYDWERTEKITSADTRLLPGRKASDGSSNYISLDDEFDVYFDNVGNFDGDETLYDDQVKAETNSGKLGYGWNANGIKLLGDDVNFGISDWYGAGEKGIGSGEAEVETKSGTNIKTHETTECTGWIYAKYVTFNIPVYVAKEKDGTINPTYNVYDVDGNLRDLEFVEAGTPVYLGEYLGDHSKPDDNEGGFVDYGAPGKTKDKNGEPFTYHFWCPLAAGESKNSVKVNFHTVNINNEKAFGNPVGNNSVKLGDGIISPAINKDESTAFDPEYGAKQVYTSVVGRIGALTIVDTGDPRYSDSFKRTDLTNPNIENFLIYPIVRKVMYYSNAMDGKMGSQRGIVLDPFDVRGRICTKWMVENVANSITNFLDPRKYRRYVGESYNTYGTQWFKDSLERYKRGESADNNETHYAQSIPLTPEFNKHETFANKPLRVGYEVYLSLESIGNYYGNSKKSSDSDEGVSNGNNDYGQRKVQVRPFYAAVRASSETHPHKSYTGPVDVYMRSGDTYVLINSGCDKLGQVTAGSNSLCKIGDHSISEVLSVLYNNYDPNYIETNTGTSVIDLDQNMMRRMVTSKEAGVTDYILRDKKTDNRSILTPMDSSTVGIGGKELEVRYTYGCSQMLFLRERNMTYVGGKSAALGDKDPVPEEHLGDAKLHAQKWYFGLGLPSSAVFVPHGEELNPKNVLRSGYVVNSIDVVIVGDVWTLHYESEVSKMSFESEAGKFEVEQWNPWKDTYPYLVPVTYYNIGDTSTADLDTQGSH